MWFRKIEIATLFILFIGLFSCEKIVTNPNPETTPIAIFEEYTTIVKEKYAMLEYKEVNIEQLTDSLRPFVNNTIDDDSLFAVLGIIVQKLRDGHSVLLEEDSEGEFVRFSGYNFIEGFPNSYIPSIVFENYTNPITAPEIKSLGTIGQPDLRLVYGRLSQDNELGYLAIPSFDTDISVEELEMVFASFSSAKGLIVDIRGNTGGDPVLATNLAAYFTANEIPIGFETFKVGPGKDDFVKSFANLKPADSEFRFLKPVAVLTDRFVYSAATTFCYSVNPLDHVTFIGQRTGGGSGSVADGFLANGWIWDLSVSEFVGIDDLGNEQHLDNGFEPDIKVFLNVSNPSKDEIIERAISELQ